MLLSAPRQALLETLGIHPAGRAGAAAAPEPAPALATATGDGAAEPGPRDAAGNGPSTWVPQSPAQQSAYQRVLAQFKGRKDAEESAHVAAALVAVKERVDAVEAQLPELRKRDPARAARIEAMLPAFHKSLLAKDAYYGDSLPELLPAGVKRLDKAGLEDAGLEPEDLQDPDSGYNASVYFDANSGEYTLANRGTVDTKNMKTDALQAIGQRDAAYDEAIVAAQKLKAAVGGRYKVSTTGHSLGGGEAMAQALVTGIPCTVFNAAGVNEHTLAPYHRNFSKAKDLVTAYNVKGEILNFSQDHVPGLPEVQGNRISLPAVEAPAQAADGSAQLGAHMGTLETATHTLSLHYMQNVIFSMASEIAGEGSGT